MVLEDAVDIIRLNNAVDERWMERSKTFQDVKSYINSIKNSISRKKIKRLHAQFYKLNFLKMKIKLILVSMLAVATLASCSKDEGGTPATPEMGNFEVVLPGAIGSRAIEDPKDAGAITPSYNDVTTYLVDIGGNCVKHDWTPEQISAGVKRFEQIVIPKEVIVIANSGNVTLAVNTTKSDLETTMKTLAIANQNASTFSTDGIAGVQRVTLMGSTTSFTDMGTDTEGDDGHHLYETTVTLTSLVSRFEAGTVKGGTGLKSLTVQAVYLNYFYNTYKMDDPQRLTQSDDWTNFAPDWATDAGSTTVDSGANTKCYAYQVFTGNMVPHIIYKVSGEVDTDYKLSDGTTGVFSDKYITVKGFKVNIGGADKALVGTITDADNQYQMKVNEIYKMGISSPIEITPEQITPQPEMDKVDLIVTIDVAAWTAQDVTPEI